MAPKLAMELFREMVSRSEDQIDLALASLFIALDEYPSLRISRYLELLEGMASTIGECLEIRANHPVVAVIDEINRFLFQTEGYRGNTEDYYDPRNSFLNDVLDRRIGIPITLSVIYLEIGWRLGLDLHGVGMPGHFLVKCVHKGKTIFIDPFNGGKLLSEAGCRERLQQVYAGSVEFDEGFLNAVDKRQILTRMLTNLKGIYLRRHDLRKTLNTLEKILLINPDVAEEIRDRGTVHYGLNHFGLAIKDWSTYLRLKPQSGDSDQVKRNLTVVTQLVAARN